MSRKPRIRGWVEWRINTEALSNRAEPRDAVAVRIEEYLKKSGEPVPSRETLNKMISHARNSDDPEDNFWSLSVLAQYETPPEVLPVIMQSWAKSIEQNNPLTIRQAKWIARLYYLLKDKGIDFLTEGAFRYATNEKAIGIIGAYPKQAQDLWRLWFNDSMLHFRITGNDIPLRKSLKSIQWKTTSDIEEAMTSLKIKLEDTTDGASTADN